MYSYIRLCCWQTSVDTQKLHICLKNWKKLHILVLLSTHWLKWGDQVCMGASKLKAHAETVTLGEIWINAEPLLALALILIYLSLQYQWSVSLIKYQHQNWSLKYIHVPSLLSPTSKSICESFSRDRELRAQTIWALLRRSSTQKRKNEFSVIILV